jgi:hypothetical protein
MIRGGLHIHRAKFFRKALPSAVLWVMVAAQAIFPARLYWSSPIGGDTKWSNEANWSENKAPQPGDTVVFGIEGKLLAQCELDADATVSDILFRAFYTARFEFDGHFLSLTGDTCDLRSGGEVADAEGTGGILFEQAGTIVFFPGTLSSLPSITVQCLPGGAVACRGSGFRCDSILFRSGTFRCGTGLVHRAGAVQSTGGSLDLDSSALSVSGATVNFSGLASLSSKNGTLEFCGTTPQRIAFPGNSFRIRRIVQNGAGGSMLSKSADGTINTDTLVIRSGTLAFDDSAVCDVGALRSEHGGIALPVSARLILHGRSDFSGLDSLFAPGMVTCASTHSSVTLIPKPEVLLPRLEVTAGELQFFGTGLLADSIRCAAGCTLSLGAHLLHVARAVSIERNAVVDFGSSLFRFVGTRLDLSGCGDVIPGTGCIEFNGTAPLVFMPPRGKTCPSVLQNGPGGTTLAGCDLLAGNLVIRDGTFNLNGFSASVDTLKGNVADGNDSLNFGTSSTSEINARGCVFLDRISTGGDVRLRLSGVRQDVHVPANFRFAKLTVSGSAQATLFAPRGSEIIVDTLAIRSGTLDLGGLPGPFIVSVTSLTAAGGGLNFGGSTVRFKNDTLDLSRLAVAAQTQDGGIEFCGTKRQVFIPAASAVYPSIQATGPGTLALTGNGLSCMRLAVASGGLLSLGTALTHSVSSSLRISGIIDFGTSTLSISADSMDLSGAASILPGNGTLSFTGAAGVQVFVPKPGALHPNLIKANGGTIALGGQCSAKKLWISDGTFSCRNYKCDLTGFSAIGGWLKVGSDSLIISGNALFAGLSGISAASAPIVVKTSPASPTSVFSCGEREIGNLVLLADGTAGLSRIIAAAGTHRVGRITFAWSQSRDSAVFDFRQNNASVSVRDSAVVFTRGTGTDRGRIYMGNGTWTFTGNCALASYARDGAKIVFAADTGTQTVSAPLPLGDVVHSGAGKLLLLSAVKCRSFSQTAGVLDLNGNAVSSEGDLSILNGNDSSIAPTNRGWKLEALGSAVVCGRIDRYLSLVNAVQCTLSAAVSLKARYAVLKNCRALLHQGTASKCIDSLGNGNWLFSNKPAPPTGLYARRGNGIVTLAWNRTLAADAVRSIVYAGTGTAPLTKRDSTGSPLDTAKTLADLTNGRPYFFRVTVIDSAGAESDFSVQVAATPDSGLLEMSASRVSFGSVAVGTIADTVLSLFNGCSDTLVIASIKTSSAAFACSAGAFKIPPRQSVSDTISFGPRRPGSDSALIVIFSTASSSPDTVRVTGIGTAPRISALKDSVLFDVPAPPTAPLLRTFLVKNTGNDTLRISQVTRLTAADNASDTSFTMFKIRDIAPGDSCLDTVSFFPAKAGVYSAMFVLKSNCAVPYDTIFTIGKCGNAPVTQTSPSGSIPKEFSFQEACVTGRAVLFRYALPASAHVTLDIYNAIGRFLERPLESEQGPREYQYSWDGSHLSRGIYFCRFKAADADDSDHGFTKTIRLVFSK